MVRVAWVLTARLWVGVVLYPVMGIVVPVAASEERWMAKARQADDSDHWPIRLPELGANQQEIHLSSWLVRPGDEVSSSDRLVEVLIHGISFDVYADRCGWMGPIRVFEGAVLQVGDVLGWLRPHDDPSAHTQSVVDP